MEIPARAILNLHSISPSIAKKLPSTMSIHGLLAAQLASKDDDEIARRKDAMPTLQSFMDTTPIFWAEELQEYLPTGAKKLVEKQSASFQRDWDMFSPRFPEVRRQDYLHCWFLVSTRAFYNETPKTLKYPWEDRLALLPVADMFNHAEAPGCAVTFSAESYTVTANQAYSIGDEVTISYGDHSNDFLLAEYGFILEENQSDSVDLGVVIEPMLNAEQRRELKDQGQDKFRLGSTLDYLSGSIGAALKLILEQASSTELDGVQMDGTDDTACKRLLMTLLKEFLGKAGEMKASIQLVKAGDDSQKTMLTRRWEQIEALVEQAIKSLSV